MSNLLDKSSILITPTAYNVSEILSMKPSDGSGDADFSRNSGATRTTQDLLIETVTNNIPRIDYSGGVGHWLFEPQRTNLFPYSEDFSSWSNDNSTDTPNSTTAPDGTLTATEVTENTATGRHGVFYNIESQTGTEFSFSAFVKDNNRRYVSIVLSDTQTWNSMVVFDLTTGTITKEYTKTGYTGTSSITAIENGWYRISNTLTGLTFTGSTVYSRIYLQDSPTPAIPPSNTYTGDGTSSIYIWGAQLELVNMSSYIPTSGAATTRLGDVAINSGNSSLINSNEGVLYTEFYTEADSTDKRISLSDGTSSNRVVLYITSTNTLAVFVQNSNGVQVSFSSSITLGQYNKAAFKYKENDFSLFLNGTQVGTDTSGEVPSGLDRLNFSNSAGTSLNFYGRVKSTAVYKEALTDAELTCLTTI
jgi:hypothetical protein